MDNKVKDDQATELRKAVENQELLIDNEEDDDSEIDVLNLPPRSSLHDKHKKAKLKLSLPFIRFLLITSLLIIVFISSYLLWGNELFDIFQPNI